MQYEIQGTLVEIYPIQQKSASFKTREFVIEVKEENGARVFSSFVKFQATQDRTQLVENLSVGENIKVFFNIRGTRWEKEGRVSYFTNLDAWKIEKLGQESAATPGAVPQEFDPFTTQYSNDFKVAEDDGLPF